VNSPLGEVRVSRTEGGRQESRLHEQKLAQEGNREIRRKLSGEGKGQVEVSSEAGGTAQTFKSVVLDGSNVAPAAARTEEDRGGASKPTRATRRG
jgi:hypothetical protein